MTVGGADNRSWLDRAEDAASSAADSVESTVSSAANSVENTVSEGVDAAEHLGHEAVEAASDGLQHVEQGAQQLAHTLQEQARNIGGPVIGAFEPTTELSRDPPGRTPDREESTHTYGSQQEAQTAFNRQRDTLMDVHNWSHLSATGGTDSVRAGGENAAFDLYNRDGTPSNHNPPQVGDFVRISLPGAPEYDWVRVDSIHNDPVHDPDHASITLRPTYDPTNHPPQTNVVRHFFTDEATRTLSLDRNGNSVTAGALGRNERTNDGRESGGALQAARNRAVTTLAWGNLPGTGPGGGIPGTNRTMAANVHQWNVFTENLANR